MATTSPKELVLVTGGTGFVASWVIVRLLQDGYRVRTTLRSLKRAEEVRSMIRTAGCSAEMATSVEFVEANLTNDAGWHDACVGCMYVQHIASPIPDGASKVKDEDLVGPARDGTLRVLEGSKKAGVKRVVITSSVAAVMDGHPYPEKRLFDETDWTILDNPERSVAPYTRSKTLAEKCAWQWLADNEHSGVEIVTTLPAGIVGPILRSTNLPASIQAVEKLVNGRIPGMPNIYSGLVDVRDLAELHVKCMTTLEASGQRFAAVSDEGYVSGPEISRLLKAGLGPDAGRRVPARAIPKWVLWPIAWFDPVVALLVPMIGKELNITNAKAKTILNWQPRSASDAMTATVESLSRLGLVKD